MHQRGRAKQIVGVTCIASAFLVGTILMLLVHLPAVAAAVTTIDILLGALVYRSGIKDIRAAKPARIISFPADAPRLKRTTLEKEHTNG